MADFGVVDYGIVGVLLAVIVGLVEIVKRRIRESTNGDRRRTPTVVSCPNHIEGLAATMKEWSKQSGAQTRVLEKLANDVSETKGGVVTLVDQHKPDRDGRETWKQSARQERLTEEIRDEMKLVSHGIEQLVEAAKQNGR